VYRPLQMLRGFLALAVVATFGCSDSVAINRPPPSERLDAGPSPAATDAGSISSFDAAIPLPPDGVLREDFGHRDYVESSSVAIIDVNHGWATLPASTFPPLDQAGLRELSAYSMYNGLVSAESIVVLSDASVDASDSIELRASNLLRVSGHIRAGAGGVHLVAGRAIFIDGTIESAGPITIQLAGETGTLQIAGRLVSVSEESRGTSEVSIEARGSVRITGSIETGSGRYGDSGDITILAYGDVAVVGATASLTGGSSMGAAGGTVRIFTEGHIDVAKGAVLRGGDGELIGGSRVARGGEVALRGGSITIADRVLVLGGRAVGDGGAVSLKSAGALSLGRGVQLKGGAGSVGANVSLEAQTATIAADARAGDGDDQAGRLLLTVAGSLSLEEGARLGAGDGTCAPGGDVVLLAAGLVTLPGRGAELLGGRGGTATGSTCFGDYAGGSVRVVAHAVSGPLDTSAHGGDGVPPGVLSQSLDPSYSRVAPDIRARTAGWITSRPIPRLSHVIGHAPQLLELRTTVPPGTSVALQLADGDVDPPQWFDVARGQPVEALSLARTIRYRLLLEGRALDAPVVDGFDVALGL